MSEPSRVRFAPGKVGGRVSLPPLNVFCRFSVLAAESLGLQVILLLSVGLGISSHLYPPMSPFLHLLV